MNRLFSRKSDLASAFDELEQERINLNQQREQLHHDLGNIRQQINDAIMTDGDTSELRADKLKIQERMIKVTNLITGVDNQLQQVEPDLIRQQIKELEQASDNASKKADQLWQDVKKAKAGYYQLEQDLLTQKDNCTSIIRSNNHQIQALQSRLDELVQDG